MDFHSLTRRDLQSLCKLNKIPANITNVAMADALQSLDTVVGIEEFLNESQSETADLIETAETVEVPSPKAPQTRCGTSTRQKVKPVETENLQTTVTRTTRRGSKQLPKEVEESKNDLLKTPAVPRTSRKAPATTTRRNVNIQLNECEDEPKDEGLVENRYSTRRLTRLTEKKSAAPRVKKGVEKAVKIDSFLDQGNSAAEVEDTCNAFENLDVVVIEEESAHKSVEEYEDSSEGTNLKQESKENTISSEDGDLEDNLQISEVKNDVKPESDEDCDEVDLKNSEVQVYDPSSQCEDKNLVQKVQEEHSVADDTSSPCEDEKLEIEENISVMVQEEITDSLLESGVDVEMEHEDTPCVDSEMIIDNTEDAIDEIITKDVEEMSENTAVDAIPLIDDHSTMTENNVTEKSDADSGPTQSPLILSEVTCHPTHVTPFKKATPFKNMTAEVEDNKPELFTEKNVNEKSDADSGPTQDPLILNDVTGHPTQVAPFKNTLSVITDDKENNVVEGTNRKKEKDETKKIKSYNELSMRQLKKQLKALTLKSNIKEEAAAAGTTRPALQALCENQMVVGGETQN